MSNTYFCKSTLKYNGTVYSRGDEVVLDDQTADALLGDVVQSQPIPEEELETKSVSVDESEKEVGPEVGGDEPVKSGEPVLDGSQTDKPASGGILGRMFGGSKTDDKVGDETNQPEETKVDETPTSPVSNETPADPVNDPSANL